MGHGGEVLGIAISPDGQTALSAADDGTVRLWYLATGRLLRVHQLLPDDQHVYEPQDGPITARILDIHPAEARGPLPEPLMLQRSNVLPGPAR